MNNIGITICNLDALENLKLLLHKVKDIDGDVAEIGVYKGGSALEISKILTNDNIYLFDTFEGLPETNEYDNYHKKGDFNDVSYENILKLFENNNKIQIYKGVFPIENSEVLNNKKFKFVHLDVDIYDSYKNCLNFFHDKMAKGGIIVFDDYNASTCLGAKKAIDEFVLSKNLNLIFGGGDSQTYVIYK
jgi:predicted O-methyltransferase YrrM